MASQRKNLATFTIMIGVLTLVLAASALAEKEHEGHLPERNGRGTTEAMLAAGIPAWILILFSAVSGSVKNRNSNCDNTYSTKRIGPHGCQTMAYHMLMRWPMRWQNFATHGKDLKGGIY